MHKINALKGLASITIATVSLFILFSTHLIDWHHGLIMAAGGVVGGYGGAQLAQKVSSHKVRIAVIAIGLTTAAYLAF